MNNLLLKMMLMSLVLFAGTEAFYSHSCSLRCIMVNCHKAFDVPCKRKCKCDCLKAQVNKEASYANLNGEPTEKLDF